MDINEFLDQHGHNVTELIITWYLQHLEAGGKAHDLLQHHFEEVSAEGKQLFSTPSAPRLKEYKETNIIQTMHSKGNLL